MEVNSMAKTRTIIVRKDDFNKLSDGSSVWDIFLDYAKPVMRIAVDEIELTFIPVKAKSYSSIGKLIDVKQFEVKA